MTKIIIAILAFVVSVVLFFGYTRPAFDRVQSIKADIEQFDQALQKSRELQEIKQSLLSRYNTFSTQDLSRLSRLLPDHVDNVRLVLDLDSLASKYDMAVQNVLISGNTEDEEARSVSVLGSLSEQDESFDSLTLQFATAGTYDNFVRLLSDLETSLRIVDLVGLSVEPFRSQQTFTEPMYEYEIAIRTYWLK